MIYKEKLSNKDLEYFKAEFRYNNDPDFFEA